MKKNHRQRNCSICNTRGGKKQEIQNLWKKTVIKVSHDFYVQQANDKCQANDQKSGFFIHARKRP